MLTLPVHTVTSSVYCHFVLSVFPFVLHLYSYCHIIAWFFFAFGSSVRLLEYPFGILGILHSWFIKHLSLYYLQFDDHCNLIVVTTNADIHTTSNGQQTDSTTTMLTTHEKTTDQITTLSDITTTDLRTTSYSTTDLPTTTTVMTTTDSQTTSDAITTTYSPTTTASQTTSDSITTTYSPTTTDSQTTSDSITTYSLTTTDSQTTSDSITTTNAPTTTSMMTTTDSQTTSDSITTTILQTTTDRTTVESISYRCSVDAVIYASTLSEVWLFMDGYIQIYSAISDLTTTNFRREKITDIFIDGPSSLEAGYFDGTNTVLIKGNIL